MSLPCRPLGPTTVNLDNRVPPRSPSEIPDFTTDYAQPVLGGQSGPTSGVAKLMVTYGYFS